MISETVRVRFAPSPTGYLHIGGLRTALYNYLFARNQNGKFILRIEDTDRNRHVAGADDILVQTLKWVGLNYDEGLDKEGEFGPYLQSQRLKFYNKYADELIKSKNAYYCFCTSERLKTLKDEQQKQKLPQTKYDKKCLSLSNSEIKEKLESGIPKVVRLDVQPSKKIVFDDIIRDRVEFNSDNIDDQILVKSDGYPTYHLANVVDDHLMKITHVIRGEEWLSSTPKHILLYEYLGWEKPVFAHLPLLLNPDRSKLSKRQGDVSVEDFRDKGYFREALINFVALLGWNAGDDKEFYFIDELIEKFSLDRVNKAGAIFNVEKLDWLNAEHFRMKSNNEILSMLKEELGTSKYAEQNFGEEYLLVVIETMKERVSFVKEYLTKCPYFFEAPEVYDETVIKKRWREDSPKYLKILTEKFSALEDPTKEEYENALKKTAEEQNIGIGKLIHPLRLVTSGMGVGPGVYDILKIIGKDETLARIQRGIDKIKL